MYVRNKDEYQPIPLTDRWMEALGFRFDFKHSNWVKGSVEIEENWGATLDHGKHQLRYIHELQNLYFDLTGKYLPL